MSRWESLLFVYFTSSPAEVRKKADGNKSEISQEDTASEAEINMEEPLNGEEGEEEGLVQDDCEDELVRDPRQAPLSQQCRQNSLVPLQQCSKLLEKAIFLFHFLQMC